MIPAALVTSLGLRRPLLEKVMDYLKSRIEAELADQRPVAIEPRLKSPESIYQKLQTGRYSDLNQLDDLIGLKIVMLYRHQVFAAQQIISKCGLTVVDTSYGRSVKPADFSHREPKLSLKPPADYRERNPDVESIVAEVQFTTALQHALDMATHKFDYKGTSYSWENFRLVAQLRGTLELVDTILDDLEKARMPPEATLVKPREFTEATETLEVIQNCFAPEALPGDRRRMTDTVRNWLAALELSSADLAALMQDHQDLATSLSVDPTSAVLGALLRHNGANLVASTDHFFCVTTELETICDEARLIPADRRVQFTTSSGS